MNMDDMPMTLDVDWKLVVAHFFEWNMYSAVKLWLHWEMKPTKWWNVETEYQLTICFGCLKDKARVGTNPMWLASWLMLCIIVQWGKVKQFGQVQLWKLPFQNAAFPKWYDFSLFQKQLCLLDPERPAHQNSSKMPSSKIGPSNSWSCGWVHPSVPEKQSD